ncbi:AAA-domain-containing protein, partial [Suhomyces tanzawaensis NRRL Y-17324]
MSRRGRRTVIDDDDDLEFETKEELPPRRSRKANSYNEDDAFEGLEGIEGIEDEPLEEAPKEEPDQEPEDIFSPSEEEKDDGGDDYVEHAPSSRRKRSRSKRTRIESEDDEFYDEGGVSDDDDFIEKLEQKQFIATDDEDDDNDDFGYGGAPPRKKKTRSRTRSIEPRPRGRLTRSGRAHGEDEAPHSPEGGDSPEEDDIKREIEDLYDSSPMNTPVKHKLRDRIQKVDYTIPPPITADHQLDSVRGPTPPFSRSRGRKQPSKNDYRKILFPTAGPFGGSDVISLFGTNIPPGGIPIPGMTNDNNMTAIGQNLSDSDSSEDEIAPINGEATLSKKKPSSGPKLITGGSDETKGKKKNNLSDTDPLGVDMNIDFTAVGGLDNYINQLKEMVALPLLYPELYQIFDITPPRGVLFHGPPGTGKTLMARALASSCSTSERKITFFMRKGADCLSKWVGEAERQLRLLFEEAKNQQPSIIFFDEIDGLAPVRSSKQEQIHASIVSTLLALMDGMDNRGQVIVIGATNRPDSIDPALRRPGRFDREFYFPLPDIKARREILGIHTKNWKPPLSPDFVEKIAELTKGYGGADLRALCTEAALYSIQRKYPQIYKTNEKLEVNPSKITVIAKDFMRALEKIVPSSARSTSSPSSPLPEHLKSILQSNLDQVMKKLDRILPGLAEAKNKKLTALEDALYLDPSIKDKDGGFSKHTLLRNLESSRVFKPYVLITGDPGSGQQYLSSAIMNYLEGYQIQSLDLGKMFGDPAQSPELIIIQAFVEARRHQPSIIFIPNIDVWFKVANYSTQVTLTTLLRNLKSTEKVLLLGVSDTAYNSLDGDITKVFGHENHVGLSLPSVEEKKEFFKTLRTTITMKPYEFINDVENRPKRKLKELKIVKNVTSVSDELSNKKKLKQQEYSDSKLKNVLKLKLAGLMDLFKVRYKRFKKPIIDENLLVHLFEPAILDNPLNQYEVLYAKSTDKDHENMLLELSTGRYYHNMDLDIIEERLWNGYYSEPKQFLKDIKMIVKDSITQGDRERILKANEMLTNAQFGIDDLSTPEFVKACKEVRAREIEKQQSLLKEH